ncbi:MAG: YicC family protein [Gammaproteobacteria bacterium]|nr:YicC family protein [Gammaproteobacteria bacterium]
MLRSMTAFARQDASGEFGSLSLELRSVNHRYLECYVRLPDELRSLEPKIRERVAQQTFRGKVECNFSFKPATDTNQLRVNEDLCKNLIDLAEGIHRQMRNPGPLSPFDVLRWPGILHNPGVNMEALQNALTETIDKALDEFIATRSREGEKLREALQERLNAVSAIVAEVRVRLPETLQATQQRLKTRFDELQLQLDPSRLEQEMVLITQRSDVEEELKRLETHLIELQRILDDKSSQPVGRRLDFLMQEFNREANTLCSKSQDAHVTKLGIDLKVFIEQMREQVQNIE